MLANYDKIIFTIVKSLEKLSGLSKDVAVKEVAALTQGKSVLENAESFF